MPFAPSSKDTSAGALAELRDINSELEVTALEDQLQATAFALDCKRQWDAEDHQTRVEHVATEVLEALTSTAAGALSTWEVGGFSAGSLVNMLVGSAAKVGSVLNPDERALRVAARAGKALLHVQLGITAHKLIRENRS